MASKVSFELQALNGEEEIQEDVEYEHLMGGGVRPRENNILIQRKPLNEATFEKGIQPMKSAVKDTWYKSFIPPEPIRSSLMPPLSKKQCVQFIMTHIPILNWIWGYQLSYLLGDIISGITVAIMHIPQGLAYALLAKLPPVYGLYASFVPVIVYSIFGTSMHISVGTFAVVSLMAGNAISKVLQSDPMFAPCADLSVEQYTFYNVLELNQSCELVIVDIAVTVTFMTGVIMFLMGLFQFGFITIFLSESLISGYTTGAAVHVFTSQLKHIFGLNLTSHSGILSVPMTWYEAIAQIFSWPDNVNTATFIISVVTIAALIIFRIVDRRWLRKLMVPFPKYSRQDKKWSKNKIRWPIPLPSQLIVVIIATIVSYSAKLNDTFDVNIIDKIPLGLPRFTPPKSTYFIDVLQDAFVIAVVSFAVGVSLAKVFAREFNYTISPNQEFISYGAMNMVGAFFGSLNTAGSLSRSTVQAVSGGRTQLVGFISSGLILIVLIILGKLFEPLPNAVLASIIWVALYGMFSQIKDIWRLFKLSVPDMFIWLVVFTATVILGVDLGLGVGVGFSLLIVIIKVILPKSSLLGQVQNTELYRNIDNFEDVHGMSGIVVYRFQAPLCFINVKVFLSRLDLVCGVDRSVKPSDHTPGCIQSLTYKVLGKSYDTHSRSPSFDLVSDSDNSNGIKRSKSFQKALKHDLLDLIITKKPPAGSIHTLVLDCAPISFMDAMGVKTLQQLVIDFDRMGIQVLLASMTKPNRDMLDRVGFFDKCGKEWLFPSIQDAVNHAQLGSKLRPGDKEEELTTNVDDNSEESSEGGHPVADTHTTLSIDIPVEDIESSEQL